MADCVAIIGAGTMGAGIAQVAAAAGHPVLLFDSRDGAAAAALAGVEANLQRQAAKGRISLSDATQTCARIGIANGIEELSQALLVVEAIVEDLSAKQSLFRQLERVVSAEAVLTTNTSSISVTAIASVLMRPERFAGLHFFNPAPAMALVEIVSGLATDEHLAEQLSQRMVQWGKQPVRARSTPGFIVNRVARPYYAEALRLLLENASDPATLDAVMTGVGGFRMGPFALMDMIGHDVNFAVTQSMHAAWFGDPRYQPSVIQKELVDAGRLGRKSGSGFFDYRKSGSAPPPKPYQPRSPAPRSVVAQADADSQLVNLIEEAGIAVDRDTSGGRGLIVGDVLLCPTDGRSATERMADDADRPVVLYDIVRDWAKASAVALAGADHAPPLALDVAAALFAMLGKTVYALADRPGMAVARTVAMLANEAAEIVLHGVATAADADRAMELGANHPEGPLALCDRLGSAWVVRTLDNLARAYGEDHYRASTLLRRMAASGQRFHEVRT